MSEQPFSTKEGRMRFEVVLFKQLRDSVIYGDVYSYLIIVMEDCERHRLRNNFILSSWQKL